MRGFYKKNFQNYCNHVAFGNSYSYWCEIFLHVSDTWYQRRYYFHSHYCNLGYNMGTYFKVILRRLCRLFFVQKCCKKNIKFLAKKTYLFYFFWHIKFVRIWFLCFWWLYEKGQYRKRYVWSLWTEEQTSAMQPEKKKKYLEKYFAKSVTLLKKSCILNMKAKIDHRLR